MIRYLFDLLFKRYHCFFVCIFSVWWLQKHLFQRHMKFKHAYIEIRDKNKFYGKLQFKRARDLNTHMNLAKLYDFILCSSIYQLNSAKNIDCIYKKPASEYSGKNPQSGSASYGLSILNIFSWRKNILAADRLGVYKCADKIYSLVTCRCKNNKSKL